ncbi:TPA: twin-arginine translocase subunit TatC [Legionella pneumophila]|jgi:sec-independent protein translocase protein TatC|uniref:Sec-independent protein translocase protein TatC n=1 Tax=Legionella pneumophila TaxID=446 RepID=A0AAN5KS19_LEGPN|nr:twin-arginine translocase subunit TatC [Legionella pneumophila]HAT1972886.1 twin-arginine translocase subunit TatC [Legionella pneumophila]HAT6957442.1 twin-arginine translocase subunit TatC [Legionella pneumophila]
MLVHLIELRRRAIYTLLWFGAFALLFFFISDKLFHVLVKPLLQSLPNQEGLIATQITSSVFTPLKLAVDAALLLTAPFALLQLWRFMRPGLYRNEQEQIRGTIILSLLLFVFGTLFCFYLVLPFMFQFFAQALPEGVRLMPDMAYAIDFITRMLLLFGFSFQVPLICLVLVKIHFTTVTTLIKIRPYVIVGAFIVGMLLTPPDVFSQVALALPLCLLYEAGIILARIYGKSPTPALIQ